MISLLLKILSAVGLVVGIAGFVLEARGITWEKIPAGYVRPIAAALILLSLGIGGADYWVNRPGTPGAAPGVGGDRYVVGGPVYGVAGVGSIGQVTLNTGDPPEVREQKLLKAKQSIAADVLNGISSLDARLSFVTAALEQSRHDEAIQAARRRTAPAVERTLAAGYDQLMSSQRVVSLRQALNSRPIRVELGTPLINVLIESGTDASGVRFFYDQLVEVQGMSEALLRDLDSAASSANQGADARAYHARAVDLRVRQLTNQSQIAHLAGLGVLSDLGIPLPPDAGFRLASLSMLTPRRPVDRPTVNRLLHEQMDLLARLVGEKQELLGQAERLLERNISELADMPDLRVGGDDPWNVVVGKAISLRQLGRTAEAVAAFERYGQLFGSTDPTARRYSATAQQFTLQLPRLGVEGGVYLYELTAADPAARGDLAVGDIVTAWGGRRISNMPDLVAAIQAAPGDRVRVHYLRLDVNRRFRLRTTTVAGGAAPGGFMPI
ncbi:MAG TPA: PDZ domain-containing protein [Longimicrobiaceae bacterium]|nr:PDZ domain-containing protein [Longimicrobiaceae bacterium]